MAKHPANAEFANPGTLALAHAIRRRAATDRVTHAPKQSPCIDVGLTRPLDRIPA
jgi:hypothetical protein